MAAALNNLSDMLVLTTTNLEEIMSFGLGALTAIAFVVAASTRWHS
jgi:hypothetical protein